MTARRPSPRRLPSSQPLPPNEHTELVKAILLAIGSRSDARVWVHNVGVARHRNANGELGRVVKFGFKGQADLSGIVAGGRRLEIEVKTGTGRLTSEQAAFGQMIRRFGGIHIVARSVEDAVSQLDAALGAS